MYLWYMMHTRMQKIKKKMKVRDHWEGVGMRIILWPIDPLLSKHLETNNEYSRCYAIGE
jgi:hypothetical protein